MISIHIEPEIIEACPDYRCLQIEGAVLNSETSPELSNLINLECRRIADSFIVSEIKNQPAISATRKAYKILGKDPNRYRPSAEALYRRSVNEKGLYRINTLVDLINLVSLRTGYSIGGFDSDKICGQSLSLGVGKKGESFEAIGRDLLNIDGLPVFRDAIGGIGTPTSDNERTKLSLDTKRLLMTVNIYGETISPDETLDYIKGLLTSFVPYSNLESKIIAPYMG